MAKAWKMPVGMSDFREIRKQGYYFVDKTKFIEELIDGHSKVTLITRPRRFGKTLALSMLRYFFTLEGAEENRALFDGCRIAGSPAHMAEQGTRPTVMLSLKDVKADTFEGMLRLMALSLQRMFRPYVYLSGSDALLSEEKQVLQEILVGKSEEQAMQYSLANLTDFLCRHHGRPVLLLIDEYDVPIQSAWEHGYYEKAIDFMRVFLSVALKDNVALDFAVLTGVLRISKESIFSGLNNLKVCSVLSEHHADIFGFTQAEAVRIMEDCGVGDKLLDLKRWYDGYQFGTMEIYNPWSVIRFIDEGCVFRPYWLNVSGNSILHVLLERVDAGRRRELEGLMHGIPVEAAIDEGAIYADIRKSSNALYMMLLATGYLKAVRSFYDSESDELPYCELLIPNREIRTIYRREILAWLSTESDTIQLRRMLHAMLSGDVDAFQEILQRILAGIVGFHDTAHSESFYHGMMLGFSVLMEGSYRVESNRESGYGRFDLCLFPMKEGAAGVILEFKAASLEGELEKKAMEALRQIEGKAYATEMERQGVRNVWKYGIAFCGKRMRMVRG